MNLKLATALAWAVLVAALLFFALHLRSSNNLEVGQARDAASRFSFSAPAPPQWWPVLRDAEVKAHEA